MVNTPVVGLTNNCPLEVTCGISAILEASVGAADGVIIALLLQQHCWMDIPLRLERGYPRYPAQQNHQTDSLRHRLKILTVAVLRPAFTVKKLSFVKK